MSNLTSIKGKSLEDSNQINQIGNKQLTLGTEDSVEALLPDTALAVWLSAVITPISRLLLFVIPTFCLFGCVICIDFSHAISSGEKSL